MKGGREGGGGMGAESKSPPTKLEKNPFFLCPKRGERKENCVVAISRGIKFVR